MTDLLPCPFCGSTDVHPGCDAYEYVTCSDCGAQGPDIMPDVTWPREPGYDESLRKAQAEAVEAWNRRAPVSHKLGSSIYTLSADELTIVTPLEA